MNNPGTPNAVTVEACTDVETGLQGEIYVTTGSAGKVLKLTPDNTRASKFSVSTLAEGGVH